MTGNVKPVQGLFLFLILLAVHPIAVNWAGLDLHFDEAQYWVWSIQLDWSYYSKGPLLAWSHALVSSVFGYGEWQARLPAWILHSLWLMLMYVFASRIWNPAAGRWALALALTTPLYFYLGLVVTTDIFLIFFWTLGLWFVYLALYEQSNKAWYGLGLSVGIGALTKLSMGLLPAFVGIWVMLSKQHRHHILNRHVWGGIAVMLVCMAPLLYWNATHDWMMLKHEQGHVGISGFDWNHVAEYLGSQWIVVSPLVFMLAIVLMFKVPAQKNKWLLGLFLAWFLFFVQKSFTNDLQMNWSAPIYVALILWLSGQLVYTSKTIKNWMKVGMLLSVVLSAFALQAQHFGFAGDRNPLKKMKGWESSISQIQADAKVSYSGIMVDDYVIGSVVGFYWQPTPKIFVVATSGRRYSQFDLWVNWTEELGKDFIYIRTSEGLSSQVESAFASCRLLNTYESRDDVGAQLRTFYVSICQNYQGTAWPEITRY